MSDFKQFVQGIKKLGGVWNSEHVYFSYTRDTYSAAYNPHYPDRGAIAIIQKGAPWLSTSKQLGAWELIKFDNEAGRVRSQYFQTIQDLKEEAQP